MSINENLNKEIDLIQAIIKRMAENSFRVKAWMMSIIGGILAFGKDVIFTSNDILYHPYSAVIISFFLLIIVLSFWYLDAFFLYTERLYRELYKWIIRNRPNTNEYLFDLNSFTRTINGKTENILSNVQNKFKIMFSKTLFSFYFFPGLFVLLFLFYNVFHLII